MKIIDDEEYEKNKAFTIELGEPVLLEIGQKHGGCLCVCVAFQREGMRGERNKGKSDEQNLYLTATRPPACLSLYKQGET